MADNIKIPPIRVEQEPLTHILGKLIAWLILIAIVIIALIDVSNDWVKQKIEGLRS